MHPAVRDRARALAVTFSSSIPRAGQDGMAFARMLPGRQAQWTCAECRFKLQTQGFRMRRAALSLSQPLRHFSASIQRLDNDTEPKKPIVPNHTTSTLGEPHSTPASTSTSLPSHAEQRRWQFSRDMTMFVDRLLARASIAGQHINVYTGTDYSGIESLRKEIMAQEQKVRDNHRAADNAKTEHHDAVAKQAASQKEIVSLLERKSSWSPTDLERYMSLVRFEHTDDQSVQVAKESLLVAERELEDARSLLEKLERKQYHEEQVWSDTIRRNSTWVTFGLMGVNIILLLAQILVFEPYRRRKIVRDVKDALDEKTLHPLPAVVEKQVDPTPVVEETVLEVLEEQAKGEAHEPAAQPLDASLTDGLAMSETVVAGNEVLPDEAVAVQESAIQEATSSDVLQEPPSVQSESALEVYQARLRDLFSERIVQMKQVEITTVALQGAATGVAAMGMLFVLFRPR